MSEWQPIDSAPYDQAVVVKVGIGMQFHAILRDDVSIDEYGNDCDQWQSVNDGEHPPCWSGGSCWEYNEDFYMSLQPTHWMPLPDPPK